MGPSLFNHITHTKLKPIYERITKTFSSIIKFKKLLDIISVITNEIRDGAKRTSLRLYVGFPSKVPGDLLLSSFLAGLAGEPCLPEI